MTKKTVKQAMDGNVRRLRAAGWRVRNGGWPKTLVEEARWDLCRPGDNLLIPMTPAAIKAVDELCAGEPISRRGNDR
jgi:hypothetical protein